MKLIRRFILLLLAINLAFLGQSYLTDTNISYADENNDIYIKQKKELEYAVADKLTVISTQAYTSYASENAKAAYEKAISDGASLLEQENATVEQLAAATSNINHAKSELRREVDLKIKKQQLKLALEKNMQTAQSGRFLLANAPKTVAHVKDKLERLIKTSDELVRKTQSILQSM